MRKSFRAYAAAGLAATTAGVLASPAMTNLYLDGRTLLSAVILIMIGGAIAALWAAGPDERRTRFAPWALCGLAAGAMTGVIIALLVAVGFFVAIGFGVEFGPIATLAVAFAAAGLSFGAAYGAHWLAWTYIAPKETAKAA